MRKDYDLVILLPTAPEFSAIARKFKLGVSELHLSSLKLKACGNHDHENQAGLSYCCVQTGLGQTRIQQVIHELFEKISASQILLAGIAGGIDPDLKTGDVVFSREIINEEGISIVINNHLAGNTFFQKDLANLIKENHWHEGKILSVDQIVMTLVDKKKYHEKLHATCVEMESRGCIDGMNSLRLQPAFHHLRVIGDDAGFSMSQEIASLMKEDGEVNYWGTFRLILNKPWIMTELFSLQRLLRQSMNQLARSVQLFVRMLSEENRTIKNS